MKSAHLIEGNRATGVLFLSFNDYDGFKKSSTQKMFEFGAMIKQIWVGISGYADEFMRAELHNSEGFYPFHPREAERTFQQPTLQKESRSRFTAKFARLNIVKLIESKYLDEIG